MPSVPIAGICGHGLIISPALPFTPQTGKMVFPRLYTANGTSHDVSIVDPATGNVDRRVAVGGLPWGLVVKP